MNIQLPSGNLNMVWDPVEGQPSQYIPGPQGPQGLTGPEGPQGPAGNSRAIYIEDFILDNDPTADRTAIFQTVLNMAGNSTVNFVGNHRILGNLYVPESTGLVGPMRGTGQISHLGTGSGDYEGKPGVLRLSASASIILGPSAYLGNAVLVRDGLNLPFTNLAEAVAGVASFAGIAVNATGYDARAHNLLVLGFHVAVYSTGSARLRFTDIQGDCTHGILISNCLDIPYVERCHFWPFTTANYTWTASDTTQRILTRTGIGFHLHSTVDWAKLTNCFTYGYMRGFRLADVNATLLTGCAADSPVVNGTPAVPGAIGVLIEGSSLDSKVTDFTAAGQAQGLFIGTNSGCFTELTGCNNVACTIGTNVRDGDVQIIGGMDRVVSIGLQVQSSASKVSVMRKMRQTTQLVNAVNPANVQIIGSLT